MVQAKRPQDFNAAVPTLSKRWRGGRECETGDRVDGPGDEIVKLGSSGIVDGGNESWPLVETRLSRAGALPKSPLASADGHWAVDCGLWALGTEQ